jgi:hypothetical protein
MHCNATALVFERGKMLMIKRGGNGEVVLTVSGQMDRENVAELKSLIRLEANARPIVLDLKDLILADRDVVIFLRWCEADGINLKNCPAYIREWITRERGQS